MDEGLHKDQSTNEPIYRLEEEFVLEPLKIKAKGAPKATF
jgi:hypothetical protein